MQIKLITEAALVIVLLFILVTRRLVKSVLLSYLPSILLAIIF